MDTKRDGFLMSVARDFLKHNKRIVTMIVFMALPLWTFSNGIQSEQNIPEAKHLADMSVYYYNNRQRNNMKKCSRQADILFKKRGVYTDDYFVIKYYESLRDAWDGQYSDAMEEAKQFYQKAEHSNNKLGAIFFNELMGLLYEKMEQMPKSEFYLSKAADMLQQYYPHDYFNFSEYVFALIEVQLEVPPLSKALTSIKAMEQLQDDVEKGIYGTPRKGFDVSRNRRLICAYYMAYYNRMHNYRMTEKYMERSAKYKVNDWYVDFNINIEASKYYKAMCNYPMALQRINRAIAVDDTATVKLLNEKADIFNLMGDKDSAIKMYQLSSNMQKDKRRQLFDREVAGLQNMYTNMQLQLNLKQAQMQKEILHRRMLTTIALLLFAALFGMTGFAMYRGRVSKQLKKDKAQMAETSDALKKALVKADETNRLKDNFMHNISHEIRTPLNSIVGFSSIIASETEDNPAFKKFSGYIEKNTEELLAIVNNLVDLAVYQSDDFSTLQKEDVNVSSLCKEAISFLQLSGKLKEEVEVKLSGTPEDYILHTSNRYLKSILMHLLINAAKYTDEGCIKVEYELESRRGRVIFSVTDTGIGIKPENYKSIFESFEKGGSFVQGMGLGLTICRELIRKLGGEISVDPNYKEGARFFFTHPIA